MKPLTDEDLRLNEQAATVAASVLNENVIAATRCEQVTQDMQAEAAGVGGVVRGMAKFNRKLMKPMATVTGMGGVVKMGDEMRTAGLPNAFVLAVTETQIHALEDKHKDGQLYGGEVLKSWDREGLMASAGVAMGVPGDDRQQLTLFLPMDDSKGKYSKAVAAQMAKGGAPGMPRRFLVAKDAASQAVIDAIASKEARQEFAAHQLQTNPALAAKFAAAGAAMPGAGGDDSVAQLEKLAQLHASGALTDEEFAAQKAKILGS